VTQLLIQFADAELDSFRWAAFDAQEGSLEIDWQSGNEADLSSITSQNSYPVVLLIPQQCVYLTQVVLPEKAGRQLLAAIEYQIEDQQAQDIESQHFALGDTSENPISIAVVEKSIMDRCFALSRSYGLRLSQIIPELFLCPLGENACLISGYDGWLLRLGPYRGFKCISATLPTMLELVKRDHNFDSIQCFVSETEDLPIIESITMERHDTTIVQPGFVGAPCIDLQQREYQMSSRWRGLGKVWKSVGLFLAALLVFTVYNKAIALQQLDAELTDIKQQQYRLVQPVLPADTGPDDNFKKLLIDRMKQLQAGQGEQGFVQLLAEFTSIKSQYPDVRITRIGYQNKRLNIDISDQKLQNIEALQNNLVKKGVNAKLENLSIKPDLISARLVLKGDNDG
jgi:general secretion pathway protein L